MKKMKFTKAQQVNLDCYKKFIRRIWLDGAKMRGVDPRFAEGCFDSGWKAAFDGIDIVRSR